MKKEMNKLQKREKIQKECCISSDCFVDFMDLEMKHQFGERKNGDSELGIDEFYIKR